jgi:hypothetical protein
MQRKVKAAGKGAAGGSDGVGTAKAAGDKNTLKKGRNQAKWVLNSAVWVKRMQPLKPAAILI